MLGITAYVRIAGLVLLAIVAVGLGGWDWSAPSVFYHAVVGIFFLYVGFSRLGITTVRQIVGGLGVLLVLVSGMAILVTWLLPMSFLLGPIETTGLIVGVTSMLAARYLPDDLPHKARRRYSR
jgi:uncharacterized membrane protein